MEGGGQFGFEAAVMGGIPIIHCLQNDFAGDRITCLQGIMNGCTNYMLDKMETTGCSYQEVLGEAQALGFAEADPALDVGGQDARSKLKILIKLAFGLAVEEEAIPCKGITDILEVDFAYAKQVRKMRASGKKKREREREGGVYGSRRDFTQGNGPRLRSERDPVGRVGL